MDLFSHQKAIYRYIFLMIRDPSVAEDLTQETLLKAHRKLDTLEEPGRVVAWLYRIATNLCRDRFRAVSYRMERSGGDERARSIPDDAPRLDKVIEQKEMSECVQEYLAELSDSHRAAILLHDVEGLTAPEIAAMLGASLPTVKIRLHRARRKLRQTLDQACVLSRDERGVLVCTPRTRKKPL